MPKLGIFAPVLLELLPVAPITLSPEQTRALRRPKNRVRSSALDWLWIGFQLGLDWEMDWDWGWVLHRVWIGVGLGWIWIGLHWLGFGCLVSVARLLNCSELLGCSVSVARCVSGYDFVSYL
jgi:hypothetical protein